MATPKQRRTPVRLDRVRSIPRSFSWIDRELLHRGHLGRLRREEILLYFFLTLVAGPDGTSFWSFGRIARLLDLEVDQVIEALRGLVCHDLVAFEYPTFQVLSIPPASSRGGCP